MTATTPAETPTRTSADGGEKTLEVEATGGFTITEVKVNGTALARSGWSVEGDGSSSPTITLLTGLTRGDTVSVVGNGDQSEPDPDLTIEE